MKMRFLVFGKPNCPYCDKAKMMINLLKCEYEYADVTESLEIHERAGKLVKTLGNIDMKSLPQIFAKSESGTLTYVGGYDNLLKFLR